MGGDPESVKKSVKFQKEEEIEERVRMMMKCTPGTMVWKEMNEMKYI